MKNLYPLTYSQKNIWFSEKVHPGTTLGIVAGTLRMKTKINYSVLEKALNEFIRINDGLRIRIVEKDNIPMQYISEYKEKKFEVIDFSKSSKEDLYEFEKNETEKTFDLIENDLVDIKILKISDKDGGYFFKAHHLVSDAWSMAGVISQVNEIYNKILRGEEIEKKPSYLEFIEKQKEYEKSEKFIKDKEYWNNKYTSFPEATVIKNKKTTKVSTKAKRKAFVLPPKLTESIYKYYNENKVSVFSMYMTALGMYINRITGKNELNLGTVFLNRSNVREKDTIGMFVTTVPVSMEINPENTFSDFSKKVTSNMMSLMKHQRYPFSVLQEELRKKYNADDVLYEIILSYQNAKVIKKSDYEVNSRWHFSGHQTNSLTIHINDRDDEGKIIVDYDYLEELFYEKEIDFLHDHITRLLWHALDNPNNEIKKIEMISKKEREKILNVFNDTKAEYPMEKTLDMVFEEQVLKTPNNIAAEFEEEKLTYKELDEKSTQLAILLKEKGIKPDDIVGVMLYRSLKMIISIMAIMKAGGAYLPIDPDYPDERVQYMLKDSSSKVLLTTKEFFGKVSEIDKVDVFDEKIYSGKKSGLKKEHNSKNLAYVIFTSGSTGKPKGAMIEHYSVINRINWMQKKYPIFENDVILQKTPYTFDVSVWEMFWWSFVGARVSFLVPGGQKYPDKIISAVKKYNVTTMHFVPSMLNAFLEYIEAYGDNDDLKTLKQVFASGEALTVNQVRKFNKIINSKYGTKLSNLYGPTEATVDVSYFDCPTEEPVSIIPIGRPIDNIQLYILDKYQELVPIGAVGELYIAGDGLARGYVNREELTKEKFVDNPFTEGKKMYKTGDLSRWMGEGDIEYLGRIDHQIKIRGNRVELGEIEDKMLTYGGIKEVVVIDLDDEAGNKYLCAYYVSKDKVDENDLQIELSKHLPQYMVPSYFVSLDSIPLSANGKIDRKALPKIEIKAEKNKKIEGPTNDIEATVMQEIDKLLTGKEISLNDNFFSEGIDSLMVLSLQTALSKKGMNLSTEEFYNNPTAKSLALRLTEEQKNLYTPLVRLTDESQEKDKISLICFPYGGGNFGVFKNLADELVRMNRKYEVYGVNLKGHEILTQNEECLPVDEMAEIVTKYIEENISGEIILYGHCVGTALLVSVLSKLSSKEIPVKEAFIGGIFPPGIVESRQKDFDPWKNYEDDKVLSFLRKIGGPEFTELPEEEKMFFMKCFRHDVKEYYKFFKQSDFGGKFTVPLTNIVGEKDTMTMLFNLKKVSPWNKYFKSTRKTLIKNAKHYFIKSHSEEVAKIITKGD